MIAEILAPNGSKINCPYYEIEEKCQEICKEYCSISEKNLEEFENFSKDYTYFSPYFDFVFGYLGYQLFNISLRPNFLLMGNLENRCYELKKYSKGLEDYIPYNFGKDVMTFVSDQDLSIKPFAIDKDFKPCFITKDLKQIVPKCGGHRELARTILNLGLIQDRDLCQKILPVDQENTDMAEILMHYYPLLRFDYDEKSKETTIVYDHRLLSSEQSELIKTMQNENRFSLFLFDYYPKYEGEVLDWSYKFVKKEDELNEYRRI